MSSTESKPLNSSRLANARVVWTSEEAAAYLQVDRRTLQREAIAGRIPGRRIGCQWRFYKDELENLPAVQSAV